MKHILSEAQLVPGREYWLVDKKTQRAHISQLKTEGVRWYFDNRIWAYCGNNQAMERWEIFGPLPVRAEPDFDTLRQKGKAAVTDIGAIRALRHAIMRCVAICRNLNQQTFGNERGPDCARKIEEEAQALIAEALSINMPCPASSYKPYKHEEGGNYFLIGAAHPAGEARRSNLNSVIVYCGEDGRLWYRHSLTEFEERFTPLRQKEVSQ